MRIGNSSVTPPPNDGKTYVLSYLNGEMTWTELGACDSNGGKTV